MITVDIKPTDESGVVRFELPRKVGVGALLTLVSIVATAAIWAWWSITATIELQENLSDVRAALTCQIISKDRPQVCLEILTRRPGVARPKR